MPIIDNDWWVWLKCRVTSIWPLWQNVPFNVRCTSWPSYWQTCLLLIMVVIQTSSGMPSMTDVRRRPGSDSVSNDLRRSIHGIYKYSLYSIFLTNNGKTIEFHIFQSFPKINIENVNGDQTTVKHFLELSNVKLQSLKLTSSEAFRNFTIGIANECRRLSSVPIDSVSKLLSHPTCT